MKIYKVAVVDDHFLIAKAISLIVENFENFKVQFQAENGKVLQDKIKNAESLPDIVLLDISMPVMDGFATAEWLKLNHPNILTLALSVQDDDESLIKMIKAGAKGYLHKNVHPSELETALESIIKKGFYFPEWASSMIFSKIGKEESDPNSLTIKLSDREKEFLKFACTELTYKEIGAQMFCSPRTVESYRDSLFEKLNVKTRVALALFAVKVGLYEL